MNKISDLIINTQPCFSRLISEQDVIEKIKKILQKIELLKKHAENYRVVKYSKSILYLSVSTAAFATQLRHVTPQILRELQEKLPEMNVMAIQCKVSAFTEAPMQKTSVYQKLKTKKISEKTKAGLSKLSETIDSKELSEALKRFTSS